MSVLFTCSPEGAPISCGKSRKCSKKKGHQGKCDPRDREVNAFWKRSPLYAIYKERQRLVTKPRQILEESFTALQVKEEALSKKEEDVSALQRQTEALLKDAGK